MQEQLTFNQAVIQTATVQEFRETVETWYTMPDELRALLFDLFDAYRAVVPHVPAAQEGE